MYLNVRTAQFHQKPIKQRSLRWREREEKNSHDDVVHLQLAVSSNIAELNRPKFKWINKRFANIWCVEFGAKRMVIELHALPFKLNYMHHSSHNEINCSRCCVCWIQKWRRGQMNGDKAKKGGHNAMRFSWTERWTEQNRRIIEGRTDVRRWHLWQQLNSMDKWWQWHRKWSRRVISLRNSN